MRFAKYEGLGNDFMVVDAAERLTPARVAALRRGPVDQAWLDQHLPKLLEEQA